MTTGYADEVRQWRIAKEEELHGDSGWLALAGLFFLQDGSNTLGTDPASDIILPEGSAPSRAATLDFVSDAATLRVEPNVYATADGAPAVEATLRTDKNGSPTVVWIGKLRFILIERAGRVALRLWDHREDTRKSFRGREWYAVKEEYRVSARFQPHAVPRPLSIVNILGDVEAMQSPGSVSFQLAGRDLSLTAVGSPERLRFYLRDITSGVTTYPACRFLGADVSPTGEVWLDFNKTYSPPCAFTPYATCPLPPPENILPVRIEAGELYPDWQHH